MSISVIARKALWGRAGNMCAFPNCHRDLFQATDELSGQALSGAGILVGEEAHIRSGKPGGPRHDPAYEDVDNYENLMLLCPTHHTLVDKDAGRDWPVERLEQLRQQHEEWVRNRLSAEEQHTLKLGIMVAAEVQRLEDMLFKRWESIHWLLGQAIPGLRPADLELLAEVAQFLLAKDWPAGYPHMREAADRLRAVLTLLTGHITASFEHDLEREWLSVARPEKRLGRWDADAYAELSHETELNMVATWWLIEALAASLNGWITAVRSDLDPLYRFAEGRLLAAEGDVIMGVQYVRHEYDSTRPPPRLPDTVNELKQAIARRAAQLDESPQYVTPADVEVSGEPFAG